jgi:predicted O-linked N-acetylglucosamine transferase (SPINDLY family)
MGNVLSGLKRYKQAIACYDKALAVVPDQSGVWRKRGATIAALRTAANLPDLKNAPAFDPNDANGWAIRAGFLLASQRPVEASEASERALQLDPQHEAATRIGIQARMYVCDWSQRDADKRRVSESLKAGAMIIKPVKHKHISDSEEEGLSLSRLVVRGFSQPDKPLWGGERYHHDRIRIAYISTDFQAHVVGTAIVGCFEHHDRTRFETTAISLSPSDGSDTRRRIEAAVERFVNAHDIDDAAVAAMLRQWEIDIAIDLNGLSGTKRLGILAHRPAPVQVNYLGYPGTMGAPFIDYIIADHVIIPDENQVFYSEKVAYLPNAYLPWDSKRHIGERTPTRAELGLPETGFVFACFNNLYKLAPEIFDVWMRLLHKIDGSVLWLGGSSAEAKNALRRQAQARGIAPERLIFSQFVKRVEDHQARQRLADLFLDTLPYGAHSTATDALWAGLPLLTCLGKAFPGRVAASLLRAAGLPELVTTSLVDYEERALALAGDPRLLAAIREKLARNRDTSPLFDTAGSTRDLESLYTAMWKRQQSGLLPASFSIAAGN